MDTKTPKGRRRLLLVGGLVLAGVLILVYLSKNNSSSTDNTKGNMPTAVEFSSSWNSSSTWASPSGQHPTRDWQHGRRGPWPTHDRLPPNKWDPDHDRILGRRN